MRFERKFVPLELSPAEALALVRQHPAGFREAFPPRAINNLYLDTPDRRHYFAHVNGAAHRTKVRLRWYGPLAIRHGPAALEFKHKRGLVGTKDVFRLARFSAGNGSGLCEPSIASLSRAPELPAEAREALASHVPVLGNRYHRRYFLSGDGRFRLTLDSCLEFYDARRADCWRSPLRHGVPPVILELKFDNPAAADAPAIANFFPFRLRRCSKYILGVDALEG
ncbi:MAG: VTC domain-containing protein [Verrucomicrobia bacterium]|nr:VTC domain-containing protein [Verrucomicrobiota bacterium]